MGDARRRQPADRTLANATTFYNGQYQGNVPVTVTSAGYTEGAPEPAVRDREPQPDRHRVLRRQINDTTPASPTPASLRFAYSRRRRHRRRGSRRGRQGARHRVRERPGRLRRPTGPTSTVAGIGQNYDNLINAVPRRTRTRSSCSSRRTRSGVRLAAECEGAARGLEQRPGGRGRDGPAAARPGQPEWPHGDDVARRSNDDLWGYNQTTPLYPGERPGRTRSG